MSTLMQDAKYALRTLAKSPAFAVTVVLILALGIGANTAMFSVLNALVLRPLPVERAEELVRVYSSDASGADYSTTGYPDFVDWREQNTVFSGLSAFDDLALNFSAEGRTERIFGEMVSANFFEVVGVRPILGRAFLPEEDKTPGAAAVVLLSEAMWRTRFAADPRILGRTITLNNATFTVVGVVPGNFRGIQLGARPDVWAPMMMQGVIRPRAMDLLTMRGSRWMNVVGRLKPGVTLAQADAQMDSIARGLAETHTKSNQGYLGVRMFPADFARLWPSEREAALRFVGMLFGTVGLVLLLACANIANLLLARATSRRKEIAVRLALGASRPRLVGMLLAESVLLAALGGALGLVIALWSADLLLSLVPPTLALNLDLALDVRVLGFTLAASLATGLLFGLAPAMGAARADLLTALKDEAGGRQRGWLRGTLVVAQVAISLVLLVGSGLMLRSLANAQLIDPGFNPDGVLLASMDLRLSRYDEARGRAFFAQLLERVEALPGVQSAALARIIPLGLSGSRTTITVDGYTPQPGEDMEIDVNEVSPRYFETMQIPMLQGRAFTAADQAGAPLVAVVNEGFVKRFWPGQDPIGRRFREGGAQAPLIEVIGVARDGRYRTIGERQRALFYHPVAQDYAPAGTLIVRTAGDPLALAPAVRQVVQSLDPNLPVYGVRTLRTHMGASLFPVRTAAGLLTVFGALALLLASVGLYAVMTFAVGQRTREIGIRMALGAQRADVLGLVVRQGMALTAFGLAVGLWAAAWLSKFTATLLHSLEPTDPVTFAGIAALLALIALAACWVPARRAARVDPMEALRYE